MQEVGLHDPNRKPSTWTELIRPGQYVAFLSDLETGAEMNGAGLYLAPGVIRSCLIFESLSEASRYCLQKVEEIPNLRYSSESPMQEVALHDPNRKPSSWTELIRPGQYVAFLSDLETGAEMNGAGLYLAPGVMRPFHNVLR